jgi:hypothetical protein
VTLVLDSGALVALARDERAMWRRLKASLTEGSVPRTHAGVLAQVWRSGPRPARLAQALAGIDVLPLDDGLGRATGELLARSGRSDVIDAALVLLASDGDDIVTGDLDDFEVLAASSGRHVELIRP